MLKTQFLVHSAEAGIFRWKSSTAKIVKVYPRGFIVTGVDAEGRGLMNVMDLRSALNFGKADLII